jgi:hypothetical protein
MDDQTNELVRGILEAQSETTDEVRKLRAEVSAGTQLLSTIMTTRFTEHERRIAKLEQALADLRSGGH